MLLRLKAEGDGEERRCWEQGERLRREGQRAVCKRDKGERDSGLISGFILSTYIVGLIRFGFS